MNPITFISLLNQLNQLYPLNMFLDSTLTIPPFTSMWKFVNRYLVKPHLTQNTQGQYTPI